MKLDKRIELTILYETYHSQLTKKQCEIFELYYEDDYTIIEICEMLAITKNGVYNSLKKTEVKLEQLEKQLRIVSNRNDNINLLSEAGIDQQLIKKIK